MDEAGRCDRIALINAARILGIDSPKGIVARFDEPLYALSGERMYELLLAARQSPGVRECYTFGETHHLIAEAGFDPDTFIGTLAGKGFRQVALHPIGAGIEDVFMKLMHHA